MSIVLVLLPWVHEFAWFFLSATLFGFGFGSAQPAAMAMLIDRIQLEKRGLAIGTFLMGFDGGISVGAMLRGVVSLYGDLKGKIIFS